MMGRYILPTALLTYASMAGATGEYTKEEIAQLAQDAGMPPELLMLEGDVDYGAYLSGECTTCHQTSGDYDGIPPIVQWDELFFKLAMHQYKQKSRENPVMQIIAGRLNDEEIASLAAYFAQVK